jgi:hypothetical protein
MRGRSCTRLGIGLLLAACLGLGAAPPAFAQKVPISFDDFHGFTGTVDYLQKAAAAYPEITRLVEIGRSTLDRPIYVLIITNKQTGTTIDKHVSLRNMRKENIQNVTPMESHHGKPGHWIDGGTHGNEYTGTEVCLYTIDKLLTGYGSDDGITRLVDENTFYICPVVNPDGVYNSVEGGISQRQNSMMEDNDGDGRINEDGPEDLNGDGIISQFRYPDPEGRYLKSEKDPRVMIRLGRGESPPENGERYSVVLEGADNDGDGRQGEDPERGIDLNRNYPEGWFRDDGFRGGSGFYPSSAPETRAILEYFTNNTNILMVQSFHTSGGFTYRPFARWPDSRIHAKDLGVYDRVMGKKYLELIEEEVPEDWKAASVDDTGLRDQRPRQQPPRRTRTEGVQQSPGRSQSEAQQPRGWRHPYNDRQNRPYGYGIFMDWAYGQFGAYAMSTELWNWRRDTKNLPGFAGEDDRALWEAAYITYQEQAFGGMAFLPWSPFTHPQLGEGELGGWVSKYRSSNAIPGDSLRHVCDTHYRFELYKATLLPRIEITEASADVLYTTDNAGGVQAERIGDTFTVNKSGNGGKYKIVQVRATIKNTGKLATHVARGPELAGNREDAVWLLGDRDKLSYLHGSAWMQLGVIDGTMEIPGYEPDETSAAASRQMRGSRPGMMPGMPMVFQRGVRLMPQPEIDQTGNTREVTWLVAMEGDFPLKVIVTSQKGGTQVRELSIR